MNLYFVLEGEKTEPTVFPKWIKYILDDYNQIYSFNDAKENNYYMFSGGGIPSIYNHTINAIKDINLNSIYQKLIVCLDSEEIGVRSRTDELLEAIEKSGVNLVETCQLDIIVQDVCIETWFLGNNKIIKRNPDNPEFIEFKNFYDVSQKDPELMQKMERYNTKAQFHYAYLKKAFQEKNLRYNKSRPKIVTDYKYFDELNKRSSTTNHIQSFKQFIDLLFKIKSYK